jgi:adenylate cyclase
LFIPAYAGLDHAAKAIAAGRQLLSDVGHAGASIAGAIPVGAGVHTGIAFVGTVGSSTEISDFTALGDAVNTTARLAQLAGRGELLVSQEAAIAGELEPSEREHRTVEIRGREATLDVIVIEGS